MASPAPACTHALQDATRRWPHRSRASDGIMGDARHQARKSDHNLGNAFDVTHDPASGCDGDFIAACAIRDPRVKYVIFNRRIWNRERGDTHWRPYTGENPHNHHCHVSIFAGSRNDLRPWEWAPDGKALGAAATGKPAVPTKKKDAPTPIEQRAFPGVVLQRGMRGDLVMAAQERLKKLRWDIRPDGLFGEHTERIVRAFQKRHELHPDGVIGRRTWNALFAG
ncbi:MAG: peptidoglycan-binding domain-containing protein [Polyangiaceae bacterium]